MRAEQSQNRSEIIGDLRRMLPRLEGQPSKALPFGIAALDARLPQAGLSCAALHEIAPETGNDSPSALGFAVALLSRMPADGPLLFISSPRGLIGHGHLYGHGFNALGLDPARLILVEARDERQALWALEESLHSNVPAAVAGAIASNLDFKTSQRLQLAARSSGLPLLLLRPSTMSGTSAAATRWRIGAAEAARDRFGLIVRWRWRVQLERCRNGRPGEWLVEWDHVAHCFSLAATVASPALSCSTGAQPLARAG